MADHVNKPGVTSKTSSSQEDERKKERVDMIDYMVNKLKMPLDRAERFADNAEKAEREVALEFPELEEDIRRDFARDGSTLSQEAYIAEHGPTLAETYVRNHRATLPLDMEAVHRHVTSECDACAETFSATLKAIGPIS